MDTNAAAGWLGIPADAMTQAIERGEVPAIKIGDHVRISRAALLERAKGSLARPTVAGIVVPNTAGALAAPADLRWIRDLKMIEPFMYRWPKAGGGSDEEWYDPAWEGEISLHKRRLRVRVGRTRQRKDGRARQIVFLSGPVQVEFAATADDTKWASLIRPDGRKALRLDQTPPPLYQAARLAPYREITGMTGQGVPNAVALVIDRDDLHSAVHHGAVRWLTLKNLPIEPIA